MRAVRLRASREDGAMEFCGEAYNYQTRSDQDPKNLVLLCTSQGPFSVKLCACVCVCVFLGTPKNTSVFVFFVFLCPFKHNQTGVNSEKTPPFV